MFSLLVIILYLTTEVSCTLRVYKYPMNKNDAQTFCEIDGGELMSYGTEFLKAAKHCAVTDILTNTQWLTPLGCFYFLANPTKQKAFTNNHKANCAQFCSDYPHEFIGVQVDKCLCYESLSGVTPAANCDSLDCAGNSAEQCGNTHMIVYREDSILLNSECQYAQIKDNKFYLLTELCNVTRDYICKENDGSTAIQCIGPTSTPVPVARVDSASSNLGLILGITIGLLVLIVIVLVLVYVRMRKRKKQKDDRLRIQPRPRVTHPDIDDDFINAFREPPDYHNVNTRNRDPLPLIAFDGDGIDLDREQVPVYSAVHKRPSDHSSAVNESRAHQHEPAYDEVYQPSNPSQDITDNRNRTQNNYRHSHVADNNVKRPADIKSKGLTSGAYNRTGSIDGAYVGLRGPGKKLHENRMQNGGNEHVQNELMQNKLFRNSQHKHDDDLY